MRVANEANVDSIIVLALLAFFDKTFNGEPSNAQEEEGLQTRA